MRALLIQGYHALNPLAEVAELVDALASGASIFTDVLVRLQSSVPSLHQRVSVSGHAGVSFCKSKDFRVCWVLFLKFLAFTPKTRRFEQTLQYATSPALTASHLDFSKKT